VVSMPGGVIMAFVVSMPGRVIMAFVVSMLIMMIVTVVHFAHILFRPEYSKTGSGVY
jgi:hypothetical protein